MFAHVRIWVIHQAYSSFSPNLHLITTAGREIVTEAVIEVGQVRGQGAALRFAWSPLDLAWGSALAPAD